jgi:hypothetical protein
MQRIKSSLLLFAFSLSVFCSAQNLRNQHVITGGVGFSAVTLALNITKEVLNTSDATIQLNSTPVGFAAWDFGLDDYVSLGVSYTYQGFGLEYDRYKNDSGFVVMGNFSDNIVRQNIALRPLIHLGFSDKTDFYFGGRVGYTKWTFDSATGQNYAAKQYFGDRAAFQGILGIRYYPRKNFGLNAEIALGPTYVGMFGLNLKFGGKPD